MKLSFFLMALATTLVTGSAALGVPPDEIPYSLIPPIDAATSDRPAASATPATPAPYDATRPKTKVQGAASDYEQRVAIWNSPAMFDARRYVLQFGERSARSSLEEGEQFLARVSQLSPTEMTAWLERLQTRRAGLAERQDAVAAARQLSVEEAAKRLQEARQSQANINQGQSRSAQFFMERLQSQQALTQQRQSYRDIGRSAGLANQRIYFDPFAPTLDPVSPSRRVRAFAAATLPGDLPRSDPRNFERDPSAASDAADRGQVAPAPAPAAAPAAEAASAPTGDE